MRTTPPLLWLGAALTLVMGEAALAATRPHPAVETPAPRPNVMRGTVLHVLDGDTLILRPASAPPDEGRDPAVRTPQAHPLRVRLSGVDAPELCQRGGGEAREALAALVAGRQVSVTLLGTDRYARILGRVTIGSQDAAAKLVAQGLAWSEPQGRAQGPYGALEASARAQQRGVFAQVGALRPREFRDTHGGCAHAPGSRLKHRGEPGRG